VDSYFDNQRVAAESTYTYDSLYQLTSAMGRETAGAGQNPGLPELNIPSPIDPTRLLNYFEHYEYDAGGNRTSLRHESDKNPFSRLMYVDPQSNRALPWNEGEDTPDFGRHFDANGNLQCLVPGAQPMSWDARNQLQSVIDVQRSNGINDGEWYRYSGTPLSIKLLSTTCRAWKCAPPMSAKNFRLFTFNWPAVACGACIGSTNHRTMLITIKCVTALMITWGPVAWNWIDWPPSSVTRVITPMAARRGGLPVLRSMPITRPFGIRGRSGMLVGFTTMDFGITHHGWDAGSIRIRQETWIA
jgi:hypothetical protein